MEIEVIKKRAKNYRITIKPNGVVYVSVPLYASEKNINDFINKNKEWIDKNYLKAFDDTLINDLYEDSTLYILGRPYIVRTIYSLKNIILLEDGFITFYTDDDLIKNKEKMYNKFLKELINKYYIESINKYLELTGLSINKLSIKKMERSYGRCYTERKEIVLSSLLIHKTIDFIDAIVIHEIAHLKYPNHKKEFYDYINIYNKNYKENVKKYKE